MSTVKSKGRLLFLGMAIVLACIYAAPNLYGEQPSLQISAKVGESLSSLAINRIKKTLQLADLKPEKLEVKKHRLLLRYNNTNQQLKAKHVLTQSFPKLSIALHLASKTPHWLSSLGAQPMKLGLDLRGGVHFLLEVETSTVINSRLQQDAKQIKALLHERNIRTIASRATHKQTIHLSFVSRKAAQAARDLILNKMPNYTPGPIKTSGKLFICDVSMHAQTRQSLVNYTIQQTITTLNNRINELGVSEAIITRQGRNQISVDLPGIQDTARAKSLLGKTATLRFHLVDVAHNALVAEQQGAPENTLLLKDPYQRPILLEHEPILTGNAITYAASSFANGQPAVSIRLGGGGETKFHRVTSKNIGRALAVVYVNTEIKKHIVDGQTLSTPIHHERIISVATIQSALGQQFQITGLTDSNYADNLALLLRSGALAAPVSIIQELTIGPSLGQANIDKGEMSLAIGTLLVVIFMIAYYRLFGIVANLALIMNVIFIIAALSLLGATLTLPGIAGIVLTVGMAVDANVLINERIREELRAGLSPQASISAGYDRAFATIVDSNVTTLIVALILFTLGSGSVKGFAITLTIGLGASMLTAIVFTRTIIEGIYHSNKTIKQLSIGI